jgi:hypothetical protein
MALLVLAVAGIGNVTAEDGIGIVMISVAMGGGSIEEDIIQGGVMEVD